jgi:hypothetical protein
MPGQAARLAGMLFSRPLIIESPLPASVVRAQVRALVTGSDIPDLTTLRRRQIIGWRLSQANESFLFQPEYGDSIDVDAARFVGLVEPLATGGSRIRGRILASPFTRIVISAWMLTVALATVVALGQGREAPAKLLAISALTFSGAVLMAWYSLRSASRLVAARLQQSLRASRSRAA